MSRILVVTHNNNEKSGANRSICGLIKCLKSKHSIDVLVNTSKGDLPDMLKSLGCRVITADYDWNCVSEREGIVRSVAVYIRGSFRYYRGLFLLSSLCNKLKKENYDLIYTNTRVVDIGARIAEMLNVRHIWHIREFGKEDFHFRYLVTKASRLQWFNKAAAIIAVSESVKRKLLEDSVRSPVFVVYNGFETERLKGDIHCRLHDPVNVLIAGQISRSKGQDQAIRAIELVNKTHKAGLLIAGRGNKDFLTRTIKQYADPEHITVLGQVDDMYSLRNQADIELICSESEAFGRVTVEAMLHGIPVIGASGGGTSELIRDKVNGLLYKSHDVSDLADKICWLIDHESERISMAKEAKLFAETFTVDKTAKEIDAILASMTAERDQ